MHSVKLLGVALSLGLAASSAHANLLTNGSFEQPANGCQGATTTLQGWTVVTGNIDRIDLSCDSIPAADGAYLVDLTGSGSAGTISQTFATTIGNAYSVGFYFGGNAAWQYLSYGNDSSIKSMNVLIDGSVAGNYSTDTTGRAYTDAGWTYQSFLFTATGVNTTLSFASLNGSGVFGPFVDGVAVEQARVPEPGTFALLGLGLASLGLSRRRKA